MNAKTEQWESYTDEVGRRHWRWPAPNTQMGAAGPLPDAGSRYKFGSARQQQGQRPPVPLKGK
jgi:hypothetical protein